MTAARFSVVVPLYNKADYVVESVRSAVSQVPAPLEVIVVDDGSTDGGAERVEALKLPCVRLVRQANAGVAAARNTGIDAASGDWVAFLDADDRFEPGHLAELGRLANQFPSAGALATGYCRLSRNGTRTAVARPVGRALVDDFYAWWSRLTFTCASSIAIKIDLLNQHCIRFPIGERLGEDQDVWFRVAELAPVAYSDSTRVDYRLGVQGSATAATAHPTDLLPSYLRLAQRLRLGQVPMDMRLGARRLLGSHWLNVAHARHRQGDFDGAWALWRDPVARGNIGYWLLTAARLARKQRGAGEV